MTGRNRLKDQFIKRLLLSALFVVFGYTTTPYAQSEVVVTVEADEGTLDAGSIQQVEGFTYYEMQSSGSLEWSFDIATAGTYDLVLGTRLVSGTKGQHVAINGKRFKNQAFPDGESFVFDATVLGMEWAKYRISPDTIFVPTDTSFAGPDILTLEAGSHTLRLESAEGLQQFSGFSLVDAASGDTVATGSAPDALAADIVPICEDSDFCPTGFTSVNLREGGLLTFNILFPEDGDYQVRFFYYAPNGGFSDLLYDWNAVVEDINFSPDSSSFLTEPFEARAGNHSVTMDTQRGGFNVDYLEVIKVQDNSATANEPGAFEEAFSLDQNYPNPFNPTTTISYTTGSPGNVLLTIYDLLGREVHVLENTHRPAGTYQVSWDGRDAQGQRVASGIYFYRMETDESVATRRMVFMPRE